MSEIFRDKTTDDNGKPCYICRLIRGFNKRGTYFFNFRVATLNLIIVKNYLPSRFTEKKCISVKIHSINVTRQLIQIKKPRIKYPKLIFFSYL